jgi:hypothetical protein
MNTRSCLTHSNFYRVGFSLLLLIVFLTQSFQWVNAQQKLNKRYPASRTVRIELKNISGTIIVESWARDEVKLTAVLESPAARLTPRVTADQLIIDVMGENRGRGDVGSANFKLQVPVNATVDLETRQGDITVSNIRSDLVRAYVSSEGDIVLTGINAKRLIAQNRMGNIFFDGEFMGDGEYFFRSGQGDIQIRIPADSAFRVNASSQMGKIALGQFWNSGFRNLGDGRKYEGDVRNGHAKVTVANFQGSITFLRR